MGKFIKQVTARRCAVHQAVKDEAEERLVNLGAFDKIGVLEHLGFTAVAESIRWDYIALWIQEEYDCELIPLVGRFFKNTREELDKGWTPQQNPEKYIAQGHGKKTMGYGAVGFNSTLNGICLERLKQKHALTNGVGKAFQKYVAEVKKRGLALPPELVALPTGE